MNWSKLLILCGFMMGCGGGPMGEFQLVERTCAPDIQKAMTADLFNVQVNGGFIPKTCEIEEEYSFDSGGLSCTTFILRWSDDGLIAGWNCEEKGKKFQCSEHYTVFKS